MPDLRCLRPQVPPKMSITTDNESTVRALVDHARKCSASWELLQQFGFVPCSELIAKIEDLEARITALEP